MMYFKHDIESRQVNWLGDRAYTNDGAVWVPSVSEVLGIIDKGDNYHEWLKNNGRNADYITMKAMEEGTQTHELIERFNANPNSPVICTTYDGEGKEVFSYSKSVWEKFSRYINFYTRFRPEVIAVEQSLCDVELGYGGTLDNVYKLNGLIYLVDNKTGAEYPEHSLQLSAYAVLWNKLFPQYKIDKTAILYLDAATRTEGKDGAVQGKGWKLVEVGDYDQYIKDFQHFCSAYDLWKWKHPNWKPVFVSLPDHYTRSEIDKLTIKTNGRGIKKPRRVRSVTKKKQQADKG